jgi:hypothetical protein
MRKNIYISYNEQCAISYALEMMNERLRNMENIYKPEMLKRHSEYIRMRTAVNHLSALAKRWNGGEDAE